MTFTKHHEEILERCNKNFHRPRILVKKWGPSLATILQTMCKTNIRKYGIVSTITVSKSVINTVQRVQNSFIRLALRLPKYVSARLLHEASGLPYVREKLITVGQNHLARIHANPLVEHTIHYFPRRFRPLICTPFLDKFCCCQRPFRPCHEQT